MTSNVKLVELRPNRTLLNSNFDGYKLSLAPIATTTAQLKESVHRLVPDVNQYSLPHAKLFGLHNLLVGENSKAVYFVDKAFNVNKYAIEALTGQLSNEIVWQIPNSKEASPGDYNVSLKFVSEKLVIVADGKGSLYILDRGCEDLEEKWSVIFCGEVIGPGERFIISDAVYKESHLHVLLLSIRQKDANEKHSTILHWITLEKKDSWNQTQLRELTVNGFVQYANLERSCSAIYVISESGCKFTLDSENEIREDGETMEKKYKWSQSKEEITLVFEFPENIHKNLVNVKIEGSRIEIKYENQMLLEGSLHQRVDSEMTCLTVQNKALEIVLQKAEVNLMWPEVVQGDQTGEHVPDPDLVAEVAERLAPMTSESEEAPPSGTTFNSQQMEDCDFESDKLTIFERIERNSHKLTHKMNLGSHQVLLTVNLDKELPLAFGVRNDVDICTWQPTINDDEFCLEHSGTLLALGYIQASKQQMKFLVCSPDFNYAAICESTKHVFIYCQSKKTSTELKNRTTGKRVTSVAQQQVFSLPPNEEILGVYASKEFLYILGENTLTALKL